MGLVNVGMIDESINDTHSSSSVGVQVVKASWIESACKIPLNGIMFIFLIYLWQ
jgi:hypothetical protein